ncbi:MAG: hypothetical protein ABSG32_11485 [Terriglobia bacterium]|jgi:hypothetical protein
MNRREFFEASGVTLALLSARAAVGAQALELHGIGLRARLYRYQNTLVKATSEWEFDPSDAGTREMSLDSSRWSFAWKASGVPERPDALDMTARFRLVSGTLANAAAALEVEFADWSTANYVCMPGAVYNGNRYESRRLPYPPLLHDPQDIGPNVPPIISDIPRLNIHAGASRIQQVTRDMSTPAMGVQTPATKTAYWLLTPPWTSWGDSGLDIEESDDRTRALLRVTAPYVRQGTMYRICDNHAPSKDRGADFQTGDEVTLHIRLYLFPADSVQALLDRFLVIRKDLTGPVELPHGLPFAGAWALHEAKYNASNWREQAGYYAVEVGKNEKNRSWTMGWVGGLEATYPLLFAGDERSQTRAKRNFDFVFPQGIAKSGFFYGAGDGERFYSDGMPWLMNSGELPWLGNSAYLAPLDSKRWHLVRKSGDALYYLLKQFDLLKKQDPAWTVPSAWLQGTRGCADAFVRLWDKCGQFGQFVDIDTGTVTVGGSTSAAIAGAGLALAWKYFQDANYRRVAEAAAAAYCAKDLRAGITTGGPLEIAQAADCESAFGLLESLIVLYETTGEKRWLQEAVNAGAYCATWVVSYDYHFPPQSTFGRLGMRTTGSIYASAQNKCAVPGICSYSGSSLFKLYRATGNPLYLELIREIAHNLTQYVSRADRQIGPLWPGAINERVEMGDWLEPIGEIYDGSGWAEVADMLTYVEVPGLYVQPDTGFFRAIDHVEASLKENNHARLVLRLVNPTAFDASVKVLAENLPEMSCPLGQNYLWNCRAVQLPAGASRDVEFVKARGTD